jgi:hypothetical protein
MKHGEKISDKSYIEPRINKKVNNGLQKLGKIPL